MLRVSLRPKVRIAVLADPVQAYTSAGQVLLWDESQPSRQVPAFLKFPVINDAGDHRSSGERSDTFDLADPMTEFAGCHQLLDSRVGSVDALFDGLKTLQ